MPFFSHEPRQPTQAFYFVRNDEVQALRQPQTPRQPVPDSPQTRYQINQRCIYERPLPGNAYMTAHVERLQPGIYEDSDKMSKSANHKSHVEKPKDGLLARSATVKAQRLSLSTSSISANVVTDAEKVKVKVKARSMTSTGH